MSRASSSASRSPLACAAERDLEEKFSGHSLRAGLASSAEID